MVLPPENFEIVYAKSCNVVRFIWIMVCSAVHNAFLDILTVGTPFSCVPVEMFLREIIDSLLFIVGVLVRLASAHKINESELQVMLRCNH